MKHEDFSVAADGFYGVYYPCPQPTSAAMIAMLGDSPDDYLARTAAKWLQAQGVSVMALSPAHKDYGHHNLPLERFGATIAALQARGIRRIGIVGASTTGMLALIAASYYPEISLTVALSPSDFVMEGFYRDGLDGCTERPGEGESTVSWQGEPLPYLPFAYRHPEYWQRIMEEAKAGGDRIASRKLFEESERRHPLTEAELIRVERIQGKLILVGAEDDVLWDTVKYIRRMERRLEERPHACDVETLTYKLGTHFVFPQSMLTKMLPVGSSLFVSASFASGKQYPKECKATRKDIDVQLRRILKEWLAG